MFVPRGVFNKALVENNVAQLLVTSVDEHVISVKFFRTTQY